MDRRLLEFAECVGTAENVDPDFVVDGASYSVDTQQRLGYGF